MMLEPLHLAVIAGMAVVTYASRLGGFLLLRQLLLLVWFQSYGFFLL